ncbi:MAG: glycosyl hydrolase [Rickettsiales bacterium]|nr:MAG: glycosyl hydrolase [Rickettsiales bacterium]
MIYTYKIILKTFKALFFTVILLIPSITFAKHNMNKINFWNAQQKGTNIMNLNVTLEDIRAAKNYGIKFIRLAPDKFISSNRDFLIGNADDYRKLIAEDLAKLKEVLDLCQSEGMPVVITMLSLPGSRWKQNNKGKDDLRIWTDKKYQTQAALFWKDLATALKDHPAIVGYNILNEPHPERIFEPDAINISIVNQEEVQGMLYNFYNSIINSIRSIDEHTPIILDSSSYADAKTFQHFKTHKEKNILYSFHIYEPYIYTNLKTNNGKFCYPGNIDGTKWDKKELENYVSSIVAFQEANKILSNRILVGEFGGNRITCGLDKYFQDLITIFNTNNWHFAFYAFREDTWDGMDYELGNKKLPWSYWQSIDKGQIPKLERKSTHSAFSVIQKDLQK